MDFYKKLTYVEFKPFFIGRQIKQFYFLESLFVGRSRWFRPRFQCNIKTLHFNSSINNMFIFQKQKLYGNTFGGAWGS